MTITGAHAIIYAKHAADVRAFFRDVLEFPSVDAGRGWLIFALPPAEIAVHPSEEGESHELYLMCDDIDATVADLARKRVKCSPIVQRPWGRLTTIKLPGGTDLGLYEPQHPTALKLVGGG